MIDRTQDGYSGAKAAEIVGITYRQLDYWARTDLVRPSLVDATGSGSRRRYSYRDLLELRVIKSLLDAGIKLESVREVFTYLQENLGEDVATANLVIQGNQAVLVRDGGELIDLVKQGQGVLNVLALVARGRRPRRPHRRAAPDGRRRRDPPGRRYLTRPRRPNRTSATRRPPSPAAFVASGPWSPAGGVGHPRPRN